MPSKKVSFVIPVYNETQNIRPLFTELTTVLNAVQHSFEIIFVDDGSTDGSLREIQKLASEDNRVFYIELSRNFGQQHALKAGMDIANGDCVISMDCDLQHPSDLIIQLITKWEEGYDVVYTKRQFDKKLPWLKRQTSGMFYKILNMLSDTQLDTGVADFRLLSRDVLNALVGLNETGLFLRGLVKWVGFKQYGVEYYARDRHSGASKYSFRKMMTFAMQGILSFSIKPLYIILYSGLALSFLTGAALAYFVMVYFINHGISPMKLMVSFIAFLFSVHLVVIGVIGVYIGRVAIEARNRPLYLIRDTNYK
jgi:polyisoprenyl-phosphate glycosyltransferase